MKIFPTVLSLLVIGLQAHTPAQNPSPAQTPSAADRIAAIEAAQPSATTELGKLTIDELMKRFRD